MNSHQRPDQSAKSKPSQRSQSGFEAIVCQCCIAVLFVLTPLATATARESGTLVALLVSALLLVCAVRRCRGTVSDRSLVLLACFTGGCGLIALQTVSLPDSVHRLLSPWANETLSQWPALHTSIQTPETWKTISLTPHLTARCLPTAAAYFCVVAGLIYFVRSHQNAESVLKWIATGTTIMALVGLGQLLFGNGKFLGLFEHPFRSAGWPAKGTFTNQNHFAHFLALGIGPCVYQVLRQIPDSSAKSAKPSFSGRSNEAGLLTPQGYLWLVAVCVVMLAIVLSFSRGGLLSLGVAVIVLGICFRDQVSHLARILIPAAAFGIVGLIAFGSEHLTRRIDLLLTSDSLTDVSHGRAILWQTIWEASPNFLRTGSGVGSHAEVYPVWIAEDFGKRFSHAENGYLQILLEAGLPGIALLLTVVILVAYAALNIFQNRSQHPRRQQIAAVCIPGLLASLSHSVFDFVWYIPACAITTIALVAVVIRVSEWHLPESRQSLLRAKILTSTAGRAAIALTGCLLVSGTVTTAVVNASIEEQWLEYRGLAINSESSGPQDSTDSSQQMIDRLEGVLDQDPKDARALADLSVLYLQRFESSRAQSDAPITLHEIRSTVRSVEFESRREMLEWMQRAFGEDTKDLLKAWTAARLALRGQPLRASPYLALHQLAFLVTANPQIEDTLMKQALAVRSRNAAVGYVAGVAALERGRFEEGFRFLSSAFQKRTELRPTILDQLSATFSPEEVVTLLKPNAEAMASIFRHYQRTDNADALQTVAARFTESFSSAEHEDTHLYWSTVARIFRIRDDTDKEILALKKALLLRPDTYSTRRTLAFRLQEAGQTEEARLRLKGCLMRKPDDKAVQERLNALQKGQFRIARDSSNK